MSSPFSHVGGIKVELHLILAVDTGSSRLYAPAALPPGKDPGNHWTGGSVGSRAGLHDLGREKPFVPDRILTLRGPTYN